ncbi:MAG TPA: hypothetical protein P5550_06645 [Bacteroidales bacterium]|nr:hypothetical protein [Bacteroidales bacterium]HRZ77071.1 hypothetical protein [Bacteroidales bacterium]
MTKKSIELLSQQLQKLDAPGLNLEAWKSQTVAMLSRIFGERSVKTEHIRNLHYDNSSWTLRDTMGKESPEEAARRSARELLEAAITELSLFGQPEQTEGNPVVLALRESLEEHLKISAYRKLLSILNAEVSPEQKRQELRDLLRDADPELPEGFFLSLFSNPLMKGSFN